MAQFFFFTANLKILNVITVYQKIKKDGHKGLHILNKPLQIQSCGEALNTQKTNGTDK